MSFISSNIPPAPGPSRLLLSSGLDPMQPDDLRLPTIHRARWVVVDADTVFKNGFVQVQAGQITAVGDGKCGPGKVIDHGDGVLCPAMVNTHTHIELSSLKGRLRFDQGFKAWVAELIKLRSHMGQDALLNGIRSGIAELIQHGCPIVGDISSLGLSKVPLRESGIGGVWFEEVLGNTDQYDTDTRDFFDRGIISASVAGHAPHTTAPGALVALKKLADRNCRPFSIHVAESAIEIEFITTADGPWADLLTMRGIDYTTWGLPAKTPVDHLDRLGVIDDRTIVVHALHLETIDWQLLQKTNCWVCICPRSNINLHQQFPDLERMLAAGLNLCLGTDSLASVDSLSIIDEMACVAKCCAAIAPSLLFKMATENGARALGKECYFGMLHPGKAAWMLYLPVKAGNVKQLFENMVNGEITR